MEQGYAVHSSFPTGGDAAILVLLAVTGFWLVTHFRLNQEYQRAVIFRIGRAAGIKGPGLFWLVPFIDRSVKVDIRTLVREFREQELVTRDGLTLKINFVMWCKVVDAQRAIVSVADWWQSVGQASETAMRDTVGQNSLEQILQNRQIINRAIQAMLDTATSEWGVQVERVEIKDIDIPENMQRAIAREAEAIREKTARVIKAEGELEASRKLREAAQLMDGSHAALELRRLQTIAEVGADHNSVIVMALPVDAMHQAGPLAALAGPHLAHGAPDAPRARPVSGSVPPV